MRKSRKTNRFSKSLLCLTTIVSLNLFGISYAVYNDSLDIVTSVNTGIIEPYFIDTTKLVGNDKGNMLNVDVGKNKVLISGVVSDNYNNNIFVDIGDGGSIPFYFKDLIVLENDGIVKSIKVSEGNDKVKLHIKSNVEETLTQHSFKYELIFEQWQ